MYDLVETLRSVTLMALPILIAVTFHELAHGYTAYKFGDLTAKNAGRLTINPIKHLDLIGALAFIITGMIGWAKPVPVNPYLLKNPRKDMIWIALAGPSANIVIAILFSILFKILAALIASFPFSDLTRFVFLPIFEMARIGVIINIGFAVFNILPIPPLDGSKVLMGVLPEEQAREYSKIEPYGFFILLALIFSEYFIGYSLLNQIMSPVIRRLVVALLS